MGFGLKNEIIGTIAGLDDLRNADELAAILDTARGLITGRLSSAVINDHRLMAKLHQAASRGNVHQVIGLGQIEVALRKQLIREVNEAEGGTNADTVSGIQSEARGIEELLELSEGGGE